MSLFGFLSTSANDTMPTPSPEEEDAVVSSPLFPASIPDDDDGSGGGDASPPRVPPSTIWSSSGGAVGGGPLGADDEDDRVALLRMPPPSPGDGEFRDYFSGEEKKDSGGPDVSELGDGANGPSSDPRWGVGATAAASSSSSSPSRAVFSLTRSLPSTSRLMKRLGRVLAVSSTAVFLLVVFPLLCNSAVRDARQGRTDIAAFYSAAGFVVITLVLSLREILQHLYNWYAPDVQKFVVRILFMVPLYSVQSWLSLRFHGPARVYIDTVRDLYEAYVIQSFVYYLIELLGGEERMAHLLRGKDPRLGGHGSFLSRFLPAWEMGNDFLMKIKHGVLQYVVIKTILTLLTTFVFLPSGAYGEGSFSWNHSYLYITVILNVSVLWAMYCLVKLFHAVKSDLRSPVNWRPIGKFLCVKGVVFFTWWQGVAIYFLQSHGVIDDVGGWTGDEVAGSIIDYLICIEMVFFAFAHMFTFTYKDYLPEGMEDKRRSGAVGWLFEGIDKRRRDGHRAARPPTVPNGGGEPPTLQAALLEDEEITPCVDENGNVDDSAYRPPRRSESTGGFSKLEDPLSLREALWGSAVPRETLDDIRRLGMVSGSGGGRGGAGRDIGLTSLDNAERI